MKTQLSFTQKFLWLFTITFLSTFASYAQQVINATIQNDGRTRQYRLYVPASYDANKPAPLILNYHGFTNNIDIQYNQSNFQQLAEDNQFIFVTPQGLGFLPGWAINNNFGGNEDDLGFSDALIDKIQQDYNINEKRIYATGFSNGGFFSYRLACELSPRIAAVASVAGSMTRVWIDNNQCQPQHPTAVLQITGSNDNVISINGNGTNEPIQDVMEYWAAVNNGDSTPDVIQLGGGSTRSIWDNGDNGVTAEFIRVQGKGHSWNGGNINTSQEIWNFFSRFDIDGEIDGTSPPPPPVDTCSGDISSFPYNESFESSLGQWSQSSNDDLNWTRDSGGTPSNNTGPSNGADGSFYLYVEASGNGTGFPNKRAILNSPCLDFSTIPSPRLNFQYHMFGSAINSLVVEARTDNTGDWINVFNRNGNQGNSWNAASIDLAAYAGQASVQLRFNVVTGSGSSGWQSDIAIDAIAIQNGTVDPGPTCDSIDFNDFAITSFSNQDRAGDFSIENGGDALLLSNNTWKYIPINYTVTPNTVIEFDFSSTSEGEIHAVGFENNNSLTSSRYFKVHGTQNYGVTNFDNYSSGTTTYVIPVGNFYTGSMDRLVFINDNDVGSGNNSIFSNVKIYEGSCNGISVERVIAELDVKQVILGNEDEGLGAITMTPNPTRDQFSLHVNYESTEETMVSIYTLLGQKKYETRLDKGVNNLSARSLGLSSGIYVIKIQSEGSEEITKKLIVQ
ncbi:T9SS type A sorting domain-containing protein [Aquimarina sp. MMG016]|uniref:T9SS type A sorting domain-containing protein n=1 Tax=Aquimarina sp. MMG016 TaxID=2822690 RepID=UPI001B3A6EF8|nr:T9SS type A sorting domain-containing protein [Aquimarina sp. MMG016]MBQ4819310.1 T9SS type A sorting domain-containing protein [Aquimarina sp. MMG016]